MLFKNLFKIKREPHDRYVGGISYIDENGKFHEMIGEGVFAVWPSIEAFENAQKARAH